MGFLQKLFGTGKKSSEKAHSGHQEKTLEVSGEWMNQIWKERSVKVYADTDAANRFLSQTQLPYLWSDIEQYVNRVKKEDDPQRDLRVGWTAAYLSHPNPLVVANTLRDHVTSDLLNSWLVAGLFPDLLVHGDHNVQQEAAKALWRNKTPIKSVFGVLTGKYGGSTRKSQSYAASGEFKRLAESIVKNLRKHCPSESKEFLNELVLEAFGPTLAEKTESKSLGEVTFKERMYKTQMGVKMTYEIHTAQSKADALSFLETAKVDAQHFYVIVETPDGNWGKDIMGIFEE